jgi:hypothetical protein
MRYEEKIVFDYFYFVFSPLFGFSQTKRQGPLPTLLFFFFFFFFDLFYLRHSSVFFLFLVISP